MKDKLNCYIVDDEPLARKILEKYISKVPFLELQGSFSSPLEAASRIKTDNPDLLFLDINMPDLDGISFIPMLNPRPAIIFTTAYDQYALKAYELEVMDYLLKPISFERFYKGVLRVFQSQGSQQPAQNQEIKTTVPEEAEYIFIKTGTRFQKVHIQDILLIEGMKDYLQIHTIDEKILTLSSFAKLEELLPPNKFIRVHKSYMVAIDKIDHIEKNRIQIANQTISISDFYKDNFLKVIKRFI